MDYLQSPSFVSDCNPLDEPVVPARIGSGQRTRGSWVKATALGLGPVFCSYPDFSFCPQTAIFPVGAPCIGKNDNNVSGLKKANKHYIPVMKYSL
jgi:hypothetical protein